MAVLIPKPKTPNLKHPVIDGVRYYGKREVCLKTAAGIRNYRRRILEMAARQDEICPLCKQFLISPTFEHQEGRGAAASWRDDRILKDGQWFNAALCWDCNGNKSNRRYHWINGFYVPQGERMFRDEGFTAVDLTMALAVFFWAVVTGGMIYAAFHFLHKFW